MCLKLAIFIIERVFNVKEKVFVDINIMDRKINIAWWLTISHLKPSSDCDHFKWWIWSEGHSLNLITNSPRHPSYISINHQILMLKLFNCMALWYPQVHINEGNVAQTFGLTEQHASNFFTILTIYIQALYTEISNMHCPFRK